jgi:dolichyl-phosphate beta-glucosyltransferase
VVIPAFNEEVRIGSSLETVVRFLRRRGFRWEVIVVDDGSTDRTADIVDAMARSHPGVQVLRMPHRGKGHAVRQGMLLARGEFRYMCDADLSTPIEEVMNFLPPALDDVDVAVGSREVPGAVRRDEPAHRHWMGRVFNRVVRTLSVRGIEDTQCGFKCFRGRVAQELFSLQRLDGFGFDVEILWLARRRGMVIREIPVTWTYREGSKVRPLGDSLRMFGDVVRVRLHGLRGHYDVALPTRLSPAERPRRLAEPPERPAATRRPAEPLRERK